MKWIAGLCLMLLCACVNNLEVPSDVIQQPAMEKILWEMMQADRFSNTFINARKDTLDRNKTETLQLYDKVFDYNRITRQQFLDSYNFYLSRPDMLKVMFDSISARAQVQRQEVYKRAPERDSARVRRDSIINVERRDSIRTRMDSIRKKGPRVGFQKKADSLKRRGILQKDSLRQKPPFRKPPVSQLPKDSLRPKPPLSQPISK